MPRPWIRIEERRGTPIQVGARTLTPVSQALVIASSRFGAASADQPGAGTRGPNLGAGLIWNRPRAVVVHDPQGLERQLPIRDVTRIAQLLALGVGALGSLVLWLALRPRSKPNGP